MWREDGKGRQRRKLFETTAGDLIGVRGFVLKLMYIPIGIKSDLD